MLLILYFRMEELVSKLKFDSTKKNNKIFKLILDWNSALFIILNGTKEEHLDMLDGGIIQKLLEEKWKTFVQVIIL